MDKFIKDVTSASFEAEVIEASRSVPVMVDFWADWCAPCRALKPVLEKLAGEYGGQFILAKLDTDREQDIAARFGIRSIPNVKLFVDGKVEGEFSGALPESAVRTFLERMLPTPVEKLRMQASRAVSEGDFEVAEARLREALELEASHVPARIDLVELLVARQAYSEADLELRKVPERERDERAEQLAAAVALWKKGQSLEPAAELEAALAKSPADHELRMRLAERHFADRNYEAALSHLLEVVRADRGALRERARKTMVDVFNLAGNAQDMVAKYRRLLSSALY